MRTSEESKENKLIIDSFDIEQKLIFYLNQIVKYYKIKILKQHSNEIETILFEIQTIFGFDNLNKNIIFLNTKNCLSMNKFNTLK